MGVRARPMILASRPTSKNEKVASIWDANASANVVNTTTHPTFQGKKWTAPSHSLIKIVCECKVMSSFTSILGQ